MDFFALSSVYNILLEDDNENEIITPNAEIDNPQKIKTDLIDANYIVKQYEEEYGIKLDLNEKPNLLKFLTAVFPLVGDEIIPFLRKVIYEFLDNRVKTSIRDLKYIDPLPYTVGIDLILRNKRAFIILDNKHNYFFHIRSGFIAHILQIMNFMDVYRKRLYTIATMKQLKNEYGRRLIFGRRVIPGPRGGKYKLLASLTHVSVKPQMLTNPLTRKMVSKANIIVKRNEWYYPNYYDVEKKFLGVKPLKDLIPLIYNTLYPRT